jgi:hypothetical protein
VSRCNLHYLLLSSGLTKVVRLITLRGMLHPRVLTVLGTRKGVLGIAVAAAFLPIALAVQARPVLAGQFWEAADSGYGSDGAGALFSSWTRWSVPESPSDPCTSCGAGQEGFTDQATWFADSRQGYTDKIEAGIISGEMYAGINAGWTDAMRPYYTTNDGGNEVNAPSQYNLHMGVTVWDATIYGSPSTVQVEDNDGVNWQQSFSYSMSCYGANTCQDTAQGETLYGDDWMSGGGDELFMYYYAPGAPGQFKYWGYESCGGSYVPPGPDDYWVTCNVGGSGYAWEPAGTGNGQFGSS